MTRAQLRFEIRRRLAELAQFATSITGTGTVVIAGGGADPLKVTGTSTLFTTELQVGHEIRLESETRQVARIDSDTVLYVNTAFAAAHTAVALSLLTPRAWPDEMIDAALNSALSDIHTALLNTAPEALRSRVTATLPATRTVTIPATLANIAIIEILIDATADAWRPLRLLSDEQWTGAGARPAWAGWAALGVTSGTGQPTAYRWVDLSTIELDNTPAAALANGIRFTGSLASSSLDSDTATLTLPEPAKFEDIAINAATADLLLADATQAPRAKAYRALAAQATAALCARFNRGRAQGPLTVNMVR
jgi:hypothetical protein